MKLRNGKIYYFDANTSDEDEYQYYSTLGRRFNTWKAEVNRICLREVNLGCDDLPDMDYYTCFVENVTAQSMARHLLHKVYYCIME